MLGRIQEDDQSAPVKIGQYWHYSRTEPEKAYRIVARRLETMDAPEEVVLDENLEAEGLEYYSAQFLCFNPSQTHIAWLEDRDGGERFVLRVRELATGKEDIHSVTDLKWSLAWGDDETLFYLRSDHAQRPCAIWKRTIFASPETDTLVWSDPDERFFMGVSRSRNGNMRFSAAIETYLVYSFDLQLDRRTPCGAAPTGRGGVFCCCWERRVFRACQ